MGERLDTDTVTWVEAPDQLAINDIARVTLRTADPLPVDDYAAIRATGSFLLIDPPTGNTLAAGLIGTPLRVGRGMTFVGRAAQLAALRCAPRTRRPDRARVVWIEGEAGAGKTALLDRATDALPPAFAVVRAEADELGADVAFGLVEQLAARTAAAPFAAGLELLDRWSRARRSGGGRGRGPPLGGRPLPRDAADRRPTAEPRPASSSS